MKATVASATKAALLLAILSEMRQVGGEKVEWSDKKNVDPYCHAYDSCASCTNAHYERSETVESSENVRQLWPHRRPFCVWCPLDRSCHSKFSEAACIDEATNSSYSIPYEYDCPLGPAPYPPNPPELLPNWMGALLDATGGLKHTRLVDLSLPGTHDTLTYDLSLVVSDDGLDDYQKLADLLHLLSGHLLPGELEEFFRLQAKTQQLTLTQQLDNGIRFLDIRIMMEYDSKQWYSIHFMQSKQRMEMYLYEIRNWLDSHPNEIVVIWLSRHGNACATGNDQYPDVTPGEKQQWFRETYCQSFDGLLLDSRVSDIYSTSITELIRRHHRVVTFATDYVEFTGSSPFALDGAQIQNFFTEDGVFDEKHTMATNRNYFDHAAANNAAANTQSQFTLMSMNTAGPPWQIVDAAKKRFLPWAWFTSCASKTNIPGLVHWCPETLLDIAQLTSYYNQIAIEDAWSRIQTNRSAAFPNALYLDALDYDGTIRTGAQLLDGAERSKVHKDEKYAYVHTVLAYNLQKVCDSSVATRFRGSGGNHTCGSLKQLLDRHRAKSPLKLWDDPYYGRHSKWPIASSQARR